MRNDKGHKMTIAYEEFEKVDLRSGTIVKAEPFLRAKKPAYKVWVDFGSDIGILQTSAQITNHYQPEDLIGKKVIGCVNLGEKNIAGFTSQFLLVGFSDQNEAICLATVDREVPNGKKMH
jgi:tRNA-binding protein